MSRRAACEARGKQRPPRRAGSPPSIGVASHWRNSPAKRPSRPARLAGHVPRSVIKPVDQMRRRHIEGHVERGAGLRHYPHRLDVAAGDAARHVRHFRRRSFLDRDVARRVRATNRWCCPAGSIERRTVIARGRRAFQISADLVAYVAGCSGAIGAHDDHIHLAPLHPDDRRDCPAMTVWGTPWAPARTPSTRRPDCAAGSRPPRREPGDPDAS